MNLSSIYLPKNRLSEFAKLRAIRASMVYLLMCLSIYVRKVCRLLIFTCQQPNKRANVPRACQYLNLACQNAKGVSIF